MIISLLVPSNRRGSSRSSVINVDTYAISDNLQGCSECSVEISTFDARKKKKKFCTLLYQLRSSKYFNIIIAVYFFQVIFQVNKNDTA